MLGHKVSFNKFEGLKSHRAYSLVTYNQTFVSNMITKGQVANCYMFTNKETLVDSIWVKEIIQEIRKK
jgi:hypothetical protein